MTLLLSLGLHMVLGVGLSRVRPTPPEPQPPRSIELHLGERAADEGATPRPRAPLGAQNEPDADPLATPLPERLPAKDPDDAPVDARDTQGDAPPDAPPTPPVDREAPLLLNDPLHMPETEDDPDDAPLVAAKSARSTRRGTPEQGQRGAGSLFNPELREVFPDARRETGGEEPGRDDAAEAQPLKSEAPVAEPELSASRTRDVVPDPRPRRAESRPAPAPSERAPAEERPVEAPARQRASGPQGPGQAAASPEDPRGPTQAPPAETEGAQASAPPAPEAPPPLPEVSAALTLPSMDTLPPLRTVASPLRMAQLPDLAHPGPAKLPSGADAGGTPKPPKPSPPGETPQAEAHAGGPEGQAREEAGPQAPPAFETPSAPDLPTDTGEGVLGAGEGTRAQAPGRASPGDGPEDRRATSSQREALALAAPPAGADNIQEKAGDKAADGEKEPEAPPAAMGRVAEERAADPARRALLEPERGARPLRPPGDTSRAQYDRLAMLRTLEADPGGGDGAESQEAAKAEDTAPPPGGGSRLPLPQAGVGGSGRTDVGAIPLDPEALRRLSDQSGLQIEALDPGQFLDLSAKESPYWSYFSDAGRRFQRAWERETAAHPYFNVENDAATVRVAVVLNRRGKVEALTFLERSLTDLDDRVSKLVEETRLGRFPRGYPDTLVIQLRVDTTGR